MATNYPGTINTFVDPSGTSPLATGPDHAQLHTDVNDTLEAIQNVMGTTAGTSILKDFTSGQFPVRHTGGTIQHVLTGGTIQNLNAGTTKITNVLDPTSAQDAATKNYVDESVVIPTPSYSYTVLTDGATVTIDHALNTKFRVTLGGNRILALSNPVVGKPLLLDIIQDTTGSRTVTWFHGTTDTVTMTIANPCVVTTTKDIPTGTPVSFTTTGALPTGLTASTVYYWIRTGATTGNLATTLANANAGTTITTTGSQSGTHTMRVGIRWTGGITAPTLSTGKNRVDTFGLIPVDLTNGIYYGYIVGQGI